MTPATETAAGKQTKTCTVCGDVLEEEIPPLGAAVSSAPEASTPTDADPVSSDVLPTEAEQPTQPHAPALRWLWLLLAAAAIAAAVLVVKRKK